PAAGATTAGAISMKTAATGIGTTNVLIKNNNYTTIAATSRISNYRPAKGNIIVEEDGSLNATVLGVVPDHDGTVSGGTENASAVSSFFQTIATNSPMVGKFSGGVRVRPVAKTEITGTVSFGLHGDTYRNSYFYLET